MLFTPLEFLALMLFITASAGAIRYIARRRYVNRLQDLADEWKMHFSVADRFRLAPRIAPKLNVPGAAGVRVVDLVYGIENESYRYIFATEYTTGVLRTKAGIRRIATFCEPRDPSNTEAAGAPSGNLEFASENLPLVEQYQELLKRKREEVKHKHET
jgi:hypothetical protein